MTLDELENKVQIHHLLVKCFYTVKKFWKSVQYIWRYSTKMHQFFGRVVTDVIIINKDIYIAQNCRVPLMSTQLCAL